MHEALWTKWCEEARWQVHHVCHLLLWLWWQTKGSSKHSLINLAPSSDCIFRMVQYATSVVYCNWTRLTVQAVKYSNNASLTPKGTYAHPVCPNVDNLDELWYGRNNHGACKSPSWKANRQNNIPEVDLHNPLVIWIKIWNIIIYCTWRYHNPRVTDIFTNLVTLPLMFSF